MLHIDKGHTWVCGQRTKQGRICLKATCGCSETHNGKSTTVPGIRN
jgi:hypothetical protein